MQSPGINVGLLDRGTRILAVTAVKEFELVVVEPHKGLVNVGADDPRLQPPRLGRLIGSSKDLSGKQMEEEWIGEGLYMNIQFKNLTLVTNPVQSARIEGVSKTTGEPWHYEVFGEGCGVRL